MRFYWLSLFLLPGWVMAQSISGTVSGVDGAGIDRALILAGTAQTYTDTEGAFFLKLPDPRPELVLIAVLGYKTDTVYLPDVEGNYHFRHTMQVRVEILDDVDIRSEERTDDRATELDARVLENVAGPQRSVEGLIRTLPGVVGRSEFSSQYNVRGGSFDENLVYVNGIEVYRPFLVRAGQQEGLSFINPDMVEKISFSSGGFGAIYGDKMSSVLDITYANPTETGGTVEMSALGGSLTFGGASADGRFSAIGGYRYRTNRLLLGALDTDGDFTTNFSDLQLLTSYRVTDQWTVSFLGNLAQNEYRVKPANRSTEFGTFQEALVLNVYFDGQEYYDYTTAFGAFSAKWNPGSEVQLSFYTSGYQTVETEHVDVIGQYLIGELNTDLGSDDFGDIRSVRGVGGYHQYARNTLDAIIFNIGHRGVRHFETGSFYWGARIQREDIIDRYKEWENIDSAGYTVPHDPTEVIIDPSDTLYIPDDQLEIWQSFDTRGSATSFRTTAYMEYAAPWTIDSNQFRLTAGIRSQHWSLNGQITVSPRASLSWRPARWDQWRFKASAGFYHQPAVYREMRNLEGDINRDIQSQLAIHYVLGGAYRFDMFDRPFVLNNEIYFKQMSHLIPFEMDNVRIRYSARNEAKGHVYGIDARINGEFVKGVESWASFSLFRVMENIEGDGAGYIPRPTDQLFNFALFFQDYLPRFPSYRVNVNFVVTGGFPFGAPQTEAAERVFRSGPYRRLDLGFIKVLRDPDKQYTGWFFRSIDEFWIGLEVFNMLATRNTVSYLWVRDISTANQYAVPNYLTSRLVNLKVHVKF